MNKKITAMTLGDLVNFQDKFKILDYEIKVKLICFMLKDNDIKVNDFIVIKTKEGI